MANKNAYELRFELLHLSFMINESRYQATRSHNINAPYPTIEDLIKDAEKMKEFMSNNS